MNILERRPAVAARRPLTPLAAVAGGLLAGTVGTLAMDLLWYGRYRRGGGAEELARWEFSADVKTWAQAPAPAIVGKRLFEGLFQRELPDERAALVNNLTHWGYGIASGATYAVVAGSLAVPRLAYGLPFGAGVWLNSYVVLPAAQLYAPIWEYDGKTLAKDLSAHLVYGLGTALAFRLYSAGRAAA